MFEGDCDPTQLLRALGYFPECFEFKSRSRVWFDLIELVRPNQRDTETLGDALRRLCDSNSAARCAFFYLISP